MEDAYPLDTYWEDQFGPVLNYGIIDGDYSLYPKRVNGSNPQCDHTDWFPNCDECGDMGCIDCADGEVSNHDCDRWVEIEKKRRLQEMNHIYETGIIR